MSIVYFDAYICVSNVNINGIPSKYIRVMRALLPMLCSGERSHRFVCSDIPFPVA